MKTSTRVIRAFMFGIFTATFSVLLPAQLSHAQNKVVVIPLGGDNFDQCELKTECEMNETTRIREATISCPSGDKQISCPVQKVVFITSSVHGGAFRGLVGADSICQGLADNAELLGVFKAWLSSSTESPNTRFTRSDSEYVLLNGELIAENYDDLTDGNLNTGICITQTGSDVCDTDELFPPDVWTNTTAEGNAFSQDQSQNCLDWRSNSIGRIAITGSLNTTTGFWTEDEFTFNDLPYRCDRANHLYCFEQ